MNQYLFRLIETFQDINVLVIGEAMLDCYYHGTSTRLSREAPVPVVVVEEKEDVPGGAANTAVNVQGLGGHPIFLSVIGDDVEGKILTKVIRECGVNTDWMVVDPDRQTLSKQRVISSNQMMVRFDQGSTAELPPDIEAEFIDHLESAYYLADMVIISDYGYGIVTSKVLQALVDLQKKEQKLVFIDSKDLCRYKELRPTVVKPNFEEVLKLLKVEHQGNRTSAIDLIISRHTEILECTGAQIAAVTLDQDGALIFENGRPAYRTYAKPVAHNRATGAGDTFISALSLALGAGAQIPSAAEVASAASSIVVDKDGTAICYGEELRGYFSGDDKFVTDIFQLTARVATYRRQGKKIIFTNGCFDILHRGHITYLNQAKSLGDILVIGLNSDHSVRRIKGMNRPINPIEDRGQVLAALSCVDHIVPFDDDTPANLIEIVQPDVYVKGGDYTVDTLPEAALVKSLGGTVTILPYVEDRSTTSMIEKIRKLYPQPQVDPLKGKR